MNDKLIATVKNNTWIIAILIIATFLRFYKINFQSLWLDEIYTMNITSPKYSLKEFYTEVVTKEGFPFLYFILLKIGYFIFGYSEYVARGFSAIAGVASVYAIYRFGKDLLHKEAGLFAALLLAVNEYHIFISQDARPYTFYFLATVFCFYRLAIFLKDNSLRNAIFYGLSAALLLNVNFFSLVNLFSQAVLILCCILLSPKAARVNLLKHSILAGFIAIILFMPNYELIVKVFKVKSFWVPSPTEESLTIIIKEFLGSSEFIVFIVSALIIYYIFRIFNTKVRFNYNEITGNKRVFTFIIYFFWFFILTYILTVKSFTDVSVMMARYFVSTLPVLFLIMGSALYFIKNQIAKRLVTISFVIIMLTNMIVIRHFYERISRTQFREVATFVIENHKNAETIYTERKYWFDYYLNKEEENYKVVDKPLETILTEMRNDSSQIKAFWYINAHGVPFTISEESKKIIDENFYVENNFDGMDAWARHFILKKDMPAINLEKFKPFKPVNGDMFKYNLESKIVQDNKLTVSGWAFFEGINSNATKIEIVLIKNQDIVRGNTLSVVRNDINDYFKSNVDLSKAGFTSTIDLEGVPDGYVIGIAINNKQARKEGLIIPEKTQ